MNDRRNTIAALIVIMLGLLACESDWDDFRKYTAGGEIVYPGRVILLETLPGKDRVQISGWLGPDPKVSEYRIFWNDFQDSVTFEASEVQKPHYFEHILDVAEGVKSFVVYTYDSLGNKSVPTSQIGTSYGQNYRKKIANRSIASVRLTDSSTIVNWEPIDISIGPLYTRIEYTVGGVEYEVESPATDPNVNIVGLLESTTIAFATIYKPEVTCIDTFSTDYNQYLINR